MTEETKAPNHHEVVDSSSILSVKLRELRQWVVLAKGAGRVDEVFLRLMQDAEEAHQNFDLKVHEYIDEVVYMCQAVAEDESVCYEASVRERLADALQRPLWQVNQDPNQAVSDLLDLTKENP